MKELIVATRNQHKLKEIKLLLSDLSLNIISLNNYKDAPEVKEDGRTLEANAKKKALKISRYLKKLVIADDSGLEVPFLGNRPGVLSARFSGKTATYASNNEKLLSLIRDTRRNQRKARFRCIVAIADNGRLVGMAEGICNGRIGYKPAGRTGFGYDPIFIPNKYKKTFAQLGIREKNKISHRSKAIIQAKHIIEEEYCLKDRVSKT